MNLLTILAIGAVTYVMAKLVHEAVGHGLTCHFSGADWLGFSTSWNKCDYQGVGEWSLRLTKAAGTLLNLLVGLVSLLALRWIPAERGATRYFFWLMAAVNLLMGAGYLAVDPAFGFGDWTAFLEGLAGAAILRWVLVGLGAGLYALFVVTLLRTLRPFVGGAEFKSAAWRLCLVPYLAAGGVLLTVSALFNSEGPVYALTSGLATLGGTSALAWMPACLSNRVETGPQVLVQRSMAWIIAGVAFAVFSLAVLGPGISIA